MIQGDHVRLHKGSYCTLRVPGKSFDGGACTIIAYDGEKLKWQVQLEQADKKRLLVPEAALRLGFSVLPLSQAGCYRKISQAGSQGDCGRGLIAAERIPAGVPIFEEGPILVAHKNTTSPQEHHTQRWRAYKALRASAKHKKGAFAQSLAVFEDLGISDHVPDHLRAGAEKIADDEAAALSLSPADAARAREKHLKHVIEVLMKFNCNQFGFENGVDPEADQTFWASAVYAFTSRANHSCAPSMAIVAKKLFCDSHPKSMKYDEGVDGGVQLAYSLREIAAGESLTFNYGTNDLRGWGVEQRREVLLERLSFWCGCERCVAEADAEACAEAGAEELEELEASPAASAMVAEPEEATTREDGPEAVGLDELRGLRPYGAVASDPLITSDAPTPAADGAARAATPEQRAHPPLASDSPAEASEGAPGNAFDRWWQSEPELVMAAAGVGLLAILLLTRSAMRRS